MVQVWIYEWLRVIDHWITWLKMAKNPRRSQSARMALGSNEMNLAIDKMQFFIADFMVEWKQAGENFLWFMFRF